jgi:aspartate/methionine/tyrosine aminotransferase
MRCTFRTKRQILEAGLKAVGIQAIPSHGGYFLVGKLPDAKSTPTTPFTPTTPASIPLPGEPYDWTFMKKLAVEVGVVGLPVSPFISDHEGYPPMARFAFCKQDSTLESVRMKFISSLAVQDANSQNISILGI